MLVSKLCSGTSKTKAGQGGLVRVTLFWKSHCATCSPACVIMYHVTGSGKGSISSLCRGMTTIDIALTNVDINQCDKESGGQFQFEIFAGTHRCKNETTEVR